MSDYMFMLESHLTGEQYRVVGQVQAAAHDAGLNVFLTGGAMRDILGGFPVRDLDFTVEGNPAKIVKALVKAGAVAVSDDEKKRSTDLRFPGGVTAEVAMARVEKFGKSGAKPQISAGTIHEDLMCRDFTINAIMLDPLTGECIDPHGGRRDLEARLLRVVDPRTFVEDSLRVLRAMQFSARLEFSIDPQTVVLCRGIDLTDLPAERIWGEVEKWLLQSRHPSIGLFAAHDLGITAQL